MQDLVKKLMLWLKRPAAMWHWVHHNQDSCVRIIGSLNTGEYLEAFHCECGAYFMHPFGPDNDTAVLHLSIPLRRRWFAERAFQDVEQTS